MPFIDITGNTYGQLTVLRETNPKRKPAKWVCKCTCGTIKEVVGSSMKNGTTKSCGCLHIATNKRQFTKHGSYLDKLYQVHRAMIQRCNNPNHKAYKDYGGRGISICDSWMDYPTFKEWAMFHGYAEGLSIERVDTDQGYSPNNCCWANQEQQARNRRARTKVSSKYIGVSWDTERKKWFVGIGIHNKTIPLGRFSSEEEAALARDTYIIDNDLKNFILNFK